jgi:hypothetical protein
LKPSCSAIDSIIFELTVDATIASLSEIGQRYATKITVNPLLMGAPDFWYRLRALAARRIPSWSPEKMCQAPLLLLGLLDWSTDPE